MGNKIFKYEINKILWGLTVILMVAIYIIICDCEIPLIQINPEIDKYMEKIFIHNHKDKTFYNIAISYVAAYIFFLLQVYIPSKVNHNHSMTILKEEIEKYINLVKLLLTILMTVTISSGGKITIKKQRELYIVEKKENRIFCFTFEESYKKLLELIEVKHSELISNPMINFMDKRIFEFIYSISVKDIISLSNNICEQMQKTNPVPIKGKDIITHANNLIMLLETKYKFAFEEYRVTNDPNEISKYDTGAVNLVRYTRNELEIKVKI